MKRLPLFKLGSLSLLLVLGGCTWSLLTSQDDSTMDNTLNDQIAVVAPPNLEVETPQSALDRQLRFQRMLALGTQSYLSVGIRSSFGEEDRREFFLRVEDDNSITDAATGETLGHVDPETQIGRWTLCLGKVHVICQEYQGTRIHKGRPVVGEPIDAVINVKQN